MFYAKSEVVASRSQGWHLSSTINQLCEKLFTEYELENRIMLGRPQVACVSVSDWEISVIVTIEAEEKPDFIM